MEMDAFKLGRKTKLLGDASILQTAKQFRYPSALQQSKVLSIFTRTTDNSFTTFKIKYLHEEKMPS
jgi:hypothetical protein